MIARVLTAIQPDYERRRQLADAAWGAVAVALTVVLVIAAFWLVTALVVGSVAIGRWIGGWQ
jgi:hypothetical protein